MMKQPNRTCAARRRSVRPVSIASPTHATATTASAVAADPSSVASSQFAAAQTGLVGESVIRSASVSLYSARYNCGSAQLLRRALAGTLPLRWKLGFDSDSPVPRSPFREVRAVGIGVGGDRPPLAKRDQA